MSFDGRMPGDTVVYHALDGTDRTAVVERWVETTIVAKDTETGAEAVFDQSDHKQWMPKPWAKPEQ